MPGRKAPEACSSGLAVGYLEEALLDACLTFANSPDKLEDARVDHHPLSAGRNLDLAIAFNEQFDAPELEEP